MNQLAEIIQKEGSVILPVAHDAITARIIEKVGFKAMSIGGFAIVGSRFGYPDFGVASYREMRDAIIEIVDSVNLPTLIDADNGYGDFLNIERLVRDYEKEKNISCIFIEDQVSPKRCGHLKGKEIISTEEMARKIRIAAQTMKSKDLWIMARTDARATDGLDEALRRGEAYLKAGADVLFIEAPESIEEMKIIGETFKGVPLLANMLDGGKTPILPRQVLQDMGFTLIAYPSTSLLLMTKSLIAGLSSLCQNGDTLKIQNEMSPMKDYHDLIGVTAALEKENKLKEQI